MREESNINLHLVRSISDNERVQHDDVVLYTCVKICVFPSFELYLPTLCYCFSTEGERGTDELSEQGHFRAWERYSAALKRSKSKRKCIARQSFSIRFSHDMLIPRGYSFTTASFEDQRWRFTKCESSGRFRGEISRQMVRKIGSFGVFVSSANLASNR